MPYNRDFKSKVTTMTKKLFHNDKEVKVIQNILINVFTFSTSDHQHTEAEINRIKRRNRRLQSEMKIFKFFL